MRSVSKLCCLTQIAAIALLLLCNEGAFGASIYGRVYDLLGRPLHGVRVQAVVEGSTQRAEGITDGDGRYTLKGVPMGWASVSASLRGFEKEEKRLWIAREAQILFDFGLPVGILGDVPQIVVSGVVRASDGRPLSESTVTLSSVFDENLVSRVRTDAFGKYEITTVQAGQYVVFASRPGFEVSASAVVLEGKAHEEHAIDLMLRPLPFD